jgi:hypothetical protein
MQESGSGATTVWWLSFVDGSVFIMAAEATSLTHARTLAVIKGIGHAAQIEGGHFINPDRAALIPQDRIGRMLAPAEAQSLRELFGYTRQ